MEERTLPVSVCANLFTVDVRVGFECSKKVCGVWEMLYFLTYLVDPSFQ